MSAREHASGPHAVTATDLATLERALVGLPEVFDAACTLREGKDGASRLVVAVVAGPGVTADDVRAQVADGLSDVAVDVCFVTNLPVQRTDASPWPDGVPVLDPTLCAEAEAAVIAQGPPRAVVGLARARRQPPRLHLDDLYVPPAPVDAAPAQPPAGSSGVVAAGARPAHSQTPALPPDPTLPATVEGLLERAAERFAQRGVRFLDDSDDGERLSYPELLQRARLFAAGLAAAGVPSRGHVILQLPEPDQCIPTFFGVLVRGAIAVPMAAAPVYQPDNAQAQSLASACRMVSPATVVVPGAREQELRDFLAGQGVDAVVLAQETLAAAAPWTEPNTHGADDTAVMLMTSGSTGQPKGVPLRHRNVIDCMRATAAASAMDGDDVVLNWLPLDHPGPLIRTALRPILVGAEQLHGTPAPVIQNPLRWLDWMDRYGVTNAWAPNFAFSLLRDRGSEVRAGRWELSQLKCLLSTAEPIVVSTSRDVLSLLQPFGLRAEAMNASWGMAETSSGVTQNARFLLDQGGPEGDKFADLGPPIAGVEVRIVDEHDRLLDEPHIGHIQVRGATVTAGYYENPERNAESFTEDGWFRTGDLGCLHEGRLTITGRSKDVIIVAGRNLYSHEVESAAELVEGVEPSFSAACGIRPAGADTDQLALFVHVQPGYDEAQTLAAVRSSVSRRAGVTPRWVLPVAQEDIPKTSIGKIQRPKLKERFEQGDFAALSRRADLLLQNEGTVADWFYEKRWVRWQTPAPVAAPLPGGTWLVFERGHGVGEALRSRLPPDARIVRIAPGDGLRLASDEGAVRPGHVEDVEVLLQRVSADHVVFAWPHDDQALDLPQDVAGFDDALLTGASSALCLLAALSQRHARAEACPTDVWLVASGAIAMDEEVPVPAHAALCALAKCVVREVPDLDVRLVDVDPGPGQRVVEAIVQEWALRRGDREVAYRDGIRHVPRLSPGPQRAHADVGVPLRNGGCYVLSGGLGGVGQTLATHLLRHYDARLLLLGRAPLTPNSEREAQLHALQRLPGQVAYAPVDLRHALQVDTALAAFEAECGAPVDGIFHLAGTAPDRTIADETVDDFAACIDPKGPGALVLSDLRPDAFFVSFSSLMGFFGGATMSAYCAANLVAEAVAGALRARGRSAYCLASSTWEDTGVSRGHAGAAAVRAQGHYAMAPAQGVASLVTMLRHDIPVLSIGLDGENPHVAPWTLAAPRPVDEMVGLCEATSPPAAPAVVDHFGVEVPLSLRAIERLPETSPGVVDREAALRIAAGRSGRAPKGDAERRMLALWSETLGTDVALDDNFFEVGGDSVRALALLSAIARQFGVELTQAAVFQAPTVEGLAALVAPDADSDGSAPTQPMGVVTIREPSGEATGSVYFVHDADGNLLLYRTLAEQLPADLRVLGLPPPTDADGIHMYTRMREMAVWFADRVLDTHGGGKLVLAGLCAGGALAFATASELEARGHGVSLVALLDAAHPHAVQHRAVENRDRAARIRQLFAEQSVGQALKTASEKASRLVQYELSHSLGGQRSSDRIQQLRDARDRRGPIAAEAREITTRALYQFAKRGFTPREVQAPVLLLRAQARQEADRPGFDDRPVRDMCADAAFGWSELCPGGLTVHDVPGGHSTMLQPPHVERCGQVLADALLHAQPAGHRVVDGAHVAIVIVNYRTPELTLECLDTLLVEREELTGFHVIVVEGGSGDDSAEKLAAGIEARGYGGWVTLLPLADNGGYAYGNNAGIAAALQRDPDLELVHLLNPDTLVRRGAVRHLVEHLRAHPRAGSAASCLEDRPGRRRPTRFRFPNLVGEFDRGLRIGAVTRALELWTGPQPGLPEAPVPVDWAPGASLMVRRALLDEIGLLDDGFFLYYEETEFLLRAARAGYVCDYVPMSRVVHLIGQSTGVTSRKATPKRPPDYWYESRRRYFEKSFGRPYSELANVAYASGTALRRLREALQGRPDRMTPHLRGVLEHSRLAGPLLQAGKPRR